MVKYYNIVEGNLRTGDIAKSSDINHIQVHVQDMAREMNIDFHDGESYILGSGDDHKNDFVLRAAPKYKGRYIDDRITFEIDSSNCININRSDVKQPILLTKTSVYSVITKLKNTSNKNIPIDFELQDITGKPLRTNRVVVPANTEEAEFEVIFDLDYFPTAPNIDHDQIYQRDGKDICNITKEEDYDEGFQHDHDDDEEFEQFSIGVSQLYFVIKRANLNETDLADNGEEPIFNPDTDLGVYYTPGSPSPEKNIYCLENSGSSFEITGKNIWFEVVYANEQTYLCTGGEAIIGGEKVHCIDSHISIEGGNTYGNILSTVYLGLDGHLYFMNSKASLTTDIDEFEQELDMPAFFLPIAGILTYSNMYGVDKEPLIMQSQELGYRPLSHHERIRRVEKEIGWQRDFAMPSRLQVTWTGKTWVDESGGSILDPTRMNNIDFDKNKSYITTDSKGNPIIKLSENVIDTIPITLKETFKGSDGKAVSLKEYDILNASYFASLENIVRDTSKGTLILNKKKVETKQSGVSTTAKEAKETKYNPWDDYKGNRPADSKLKKHEREFEVVSGKNGRNDFQSQYPAMTFYTKTNVHLTKLTIPIYKFKNCSGIRFYIWKRQNPNNQKNTVWLEKKLYTSKEFSLKKAKTKGKYQYMEKGFTMNLTKKFGKNGLSLPKGQYVIICIPIPKSGEGSVFVETYEPQNPKDFLIRYHGAANGSHFLLKTRYPEIWYNDAEATVTEEQYYDKGVATSKAIVWNDSGLEKIQTVHPNIGNNITIPKGCSYKIFADTGAGWQELTPNKDNTMNGGATTFKWKIEFYGKGDDSPILKYNSKESYAIQFILTRTRGSQSNTEALENLNNNMCLTSKPFDGDEIIRDYTGDSNLANLSNPFNQYEFARIWAEKSTNEKMLIDVQAGDRYIGDTKSPLWTYHYCDLTLDDFNKQNVNYSHYTEDVEYDENNLRLKMDSEHSYNDEDIVIPALKEFKKVKNDIDSDETSIKMKFVNSDITENQIFLRNTFDNYYDLTQYTGLTFKFTAETNSTSEEVVPSLKGIGIYISNTSELEDTPSNKTELDKYLTDNNISGVKILKDTEVLPPVIDTSVSSAPYYEGKIIELHHEVDLDGDGNKAYETGYYRYVMEYDNELEKMVYKLQQIHDIKSYKIYTIEEISFNSSSATTETKTVETTDENGETKTTTKTIKKCEYTARIELDPDSQTLKYAKEIGILSLNDEGKYQVNGDNAIEVEVEEVRGISQEYYPIFDPTKNIDSFVPSKINESLVTVRDCEENDFTEALFDKGYNANTSAVPIPDIRKIKALTPRVLQVSIKYGSINSAAENKICYMNNEYGDLSYYKHLGIQIASDVYIPKDCLKVNLCEERNGEGVFASVTLPTLNYTFSPNGGTKAIDTINLSQIFKKINSNKKIKSISITATDHFKEFMTKIIKSDTKGDRMNLFIGKIVLYRAETIPMFHKIMRYKMYSSTNGEIDHTTPDDVKNTINVRKIGTIVDYS